MITHEFKVGDYYCKLSIDENGKGCSLMTAEWSPTTPTTLNKKMWKDYRNGRNPLMKEVEKAIGGNVLVVEV